MVGKALDIYVTYVPLQDAIGAIEEVSSQQTPGPAVLRSSSTRSSTAQQSARKETSMSPTEARIRAGLRRSSRLRRKSLHPDV